MIQTVTINDWIPEAIANGPHGHWSVKQRKLKAAHVMVWASCKHAGWEPVTVRARLFVTFRFTVKRRRDIDNLYSRVKGVVDGIVKGGWIVDDSPEWLDLIVRAETMPGAKIYGVDIGTGGRYVERLTNENGRHGVSGRPFGQERKAIP